MILKLKKIYSKSFLISILCFCVIQSEAVFAFEEPIIRVLVSKDNFIRIRSDKSIPLIIEGKNFSNKKISGLTLKNENNRTILYFDKNKQEIYNLKSNQQFQIKSSDRRGIWVGQKRFPGKLNLFVLDSEILVVNVLGIEKYLSSVVGSEMPAKWPLEALKAQAIACAFNASIGHFVGISEPTTLLKYFSIPKTLTTNTSESRTKRLSLPEYLF